MTVYNPSSVYHSSITIPTDGQPRTAASVNAAFQDLADSVKFCRDHIVGPDAANGVVILPSLYNLSSSAALATPTSWWFTDALVGNAQGTGDNAILDVTEYMHHGATLATLDIYFTVGQAHSGVPTMPSARMKRYDVTTLGGTPFGNDMAGAVTYSPATPGSGAAWYAAGVLQKWTYTADTLNVIDRTKYRYIVQLADEASPNQHNGNKYWCFVAKFTALP